MRCARLSVPRPLRAGADERRAPSRALSRSGDVMDGGTVCEVVESRPPGYRRATWCWPTPAGRPTLSAGRPGLAAATRPRHRSRPLGVLGMPGFTAYAGLLDIGRPQPGETRVVAAATGPVGSVVGPDRQDQGCPRRRHRRGPEKCRGVTEELGFDAAVDHRSPTFREDLEAAAARRDRRLLRERRRAGLRRRCPGSTVSPACRLRPGRRLQRHGGLRGDRPVAGVPLPDPLPQPDRPGIHPDEFVPTRHDPTSCRT